jgi:hypothetical protein
MNTMECLEGEFTMVKLMAGRRRTAFFATLLASSALLVSAAFSGGALADSGSCAVRNQGPTHIDGPWFAYEVRNKCSKTIRVKVVFSKVAVSTGCKSVYPHGYATFVSTYPTTSWSIKNC